MNQIDLNGRHAVITGGAQGLGFAIAERLAASGASVSLWDRDEAILQSASKQLAKSCAVTSEVVDVSDAANVNAAALLDFQQALFGQLTICGADGIWVNLKTSGKLAGAGELFAGL